MKKFEDYSQTEIMDYLYDKIIENYDVSFTTAKKYLLNALTYEIVLEAIKQQINFLIHEAHTPSDEN